MPITVSLPDEILLNDPEDISREILEQVALEGFKSEQLSTAQVRRILGFDSRFEVYEFLAAHDIPWVDYDEEEIKNELEVLEKFTA